MLWIIVNPTLNHFRGEKIPEKREWEDSNSWFNYQKYYTAVITGNAQPSNAVMKYENLKKLNSAT